MKQKLLAALRTLRSLIPAGLISTLGRIIAPITPIIYPILSVIPSKKISAIILAAIALIIIGVLVALRLPLTPQETGSSAIIIPAATETPPALAEQP